MASQQLWRRGHVSVCRLNAALGECHRERDGTLAMDQRYGGSLGTRLLVHRSERAACIRGPRGSRLKVRMGGAGWGDGVLMPCDEMGVLEGRFSKQGWITHIEQDDIP